MKKKGIIFFIASGLSFLLFAALTLLVSLVDVKPIGPLGSSVGLASLNSFFAELFGVNMLWHDIAEILGYFILLYVGFFALLGLIQLIKRKKLFAIDRPILLLGLFYVALVAVYAAFEFVVVNYRPILVEGELEASYPSSHTLLAICVVCTAIVALHKIFGAKKWVICLDAVSAAVMAATVVFRSVSGVHWFTDIIAGILLSLALAFLYCGALEAMLEKGKDEKIKISQSL